MKINKWIEAFLIAGIMVAGFATVAPCPPPPPPPPGVTAGGYVAETIAVGAIAAYGIWKIRRGR